MTTPNTGATPTGPMTLEQGMIHLKSKMEANKVTAEDQAIPLEEAEGEQPEAEEAATEETDTETVSADEPEAETEEPDTRPIILPDGSQVTVEEARKGYLRQADFTKKTTELARERETLVFEKQAAVNQISGLYQQLASLQEQEPNWLQLSQTVDPAEYQRQQAYWSHKKNVMTQTHQLIEQTRAQALNTQRARAFQVLNSGEFDPAWKDPQALKTALGTVSDYLIERGLPAETLDGVTDPVMIEIAEESRRYRELMKAKPKAQLAVKGKPQPFKPGAKSTASPQSENLRLLHQAFVKNPTPANATAYELAKAGSRR